MKYLFFGLCFMTAISCYDAFGMKVKKDTDNDGWPDYHEVMLNSDPDDSESVPYPGGDYDQDGIENGLELELGTDPLSPDTDNDKLSDKQEIEWGLSDPCDQDSDNDGLSDFYEITKGSNPNHPDTDGDGWLDSAEFEAESDPNNAASTPDTPLLNL